MSKPTPPRKSILGRVPRWLNQLSQLVSPNASRQAAAQELHLFFAPNATCGAQTFWRGAPWQPTHPLLSHIQPQPDDKLELASFQFALDQVPEVQTMTFSGWGEPINNPVLPEMIQAAAEYNNPVTRVYSHGQCEFSDVLRLLESSLDHLTFQLVAPTPSAFSAAFNGQCNLHQYLQRRKLILDVLRYRQQAKLGGNTFVEVAMVVDTLSVFHMPELIQKAAEWGADGIAFETRLMLPDPNDTRRQADTLDVADGLGATVPDEWLSTLFDDDMITLYGHHQEVATFIKACQQQPWPIAVQWPVVYHAQPRQGCPAVNETLSVRADLRASNCPRQLAIPVPQNNVWEHHAWQHPECQTLRHRHSAQATQPLPVACHWCPRHP